MNVSSDSSFKPVLLVVIVFCILYIPFINKAFHIDDAEFIYISQLIGWNPLNTTPVDYAYDGMLLKSSLPPYQMTHPLLVPYVIKIVSALFGLNEPALHLSFLIFPIAALIAVAVINGAFFPGAKGTWLVVVLFLCSIPAFLVNSQNIMADVPTLAFILLSLACYVLSMERNSTGLSYMGGIFLCLAAFTSYQALFFCSVILVYILVRRQLNIHHALSLLMPAATLFAWFLLVYHVHDFFPLLQSRGGSASTLDFIKSGMDYRLLIVKGVSIFAFVGSSMLFLVPAYFLLNKSGLRFFLIFLSVTALSYVLVVAITGYSVFDKVFLSLLVSLGVTTLVIVIKESLLTTDTDRHAGRGVFFLLWVGIVLMYNLLALPWVSARHILPAFPAIILILANSLERDLTRRKMIVMSCVFALSVIFGLGSAYSDYKFAGAYRDFAGDVKKIRSASDVWYIGKWGMQYYMDLAGARYLLATSDEPKKGDFVIIPEMPRFWFPSPQLQMRMSPYAQIIARSPLPLRLYNGRSHAGFYSNVGCLLPFAFSEEPDEVFRVFRVMQ